MSPIEHPTQRLQATAGQALRIELVANAAAGLAWQAPEAPAGCRLSAAGHGAVGSGVGGAVAQTFELVCDRPGEHLLRFELRRPWERALRAVQSVKVSVR